MERNAIIKRILFIILIIFNIIAIGFTIVSIANSANKIIQENIQKKENETIEARSGSIASFSLFDNYKNL